MTRATILPALLLIGAAFGWIQFTPPRPGEGRTANRFLGTEVARRLRERTAPLGCAVMGLALLVFGLRRRESESSTSVSG